MLLSIIVSVYNLEEYISECIDSLVKIHLSTGELEIIIIDDGSTDNSYAIVEKFSNEYFRVKCYSQPNQGVGSARNLGLKHATGTYLWFIDGDDFVNSDGVDHCLAEAINQDVDVLAFDYYPVNELGEKKDWVSFKLKSSNADLISGPKFYYENFAKSYIWLYFFKREIFEVHHLNFEPSIKMQDGEILPRIMMHCLKVKLLDEKLVYYRFRNNSAVNDLSVAVRSYFYYSMVIVADRLRSLHLSIDKNDLMYRAVALKRNQLNQMLFTNLILNNYDKTANEYFIELLKDYSLLPFNKITGFTSKMNLGYNLVRRIVNINPYLGRQFYHKVFGRIIQKKWR